MKNIYKIFIGIFFITNSGFTQTNYSLDFSVGNYGRIPISATLSDFETFTMECWYYETGFTGGDERIVAHESANSAVGSFGISNGAGSYSASIEDGTTGLGGSNIATIVQNTWSHLAMTYDGITFRFFINGVQELSEVGDLNNFGPDSDDITINRHTWNTGSSSRLTGQLDELRISNIARYTENFTPQNYEFESDENTMGLWHFNQDFNDYSGNGNHGEHSGSGYSENVPPTSGGNNALIFDGSDDYISIPNLDLSAGDNITISAWIKPDAGSLSSHRTMIRMSNGNPIWLLQFDPNGSKLVSGLKTASGYDELGVSITTTDYTDGWHQIVMTYDGTTKTLFKDGINIVSNTSNSGNLSYNSSASHSIGGHPNHSEYFDGAIDEVVIWNDALTAAEVTALYNSGISLIPSSNSGNYTSSSNLQAYWNFNEGTGTTLADQTSNDNDGTISGASWTGDGAPVTAATTPTNTYSLNFDGVDDYVAIPASSSLTSLTSGFSVNFWVYLPTIQNGKDIISAWGNRGLFLITMESGNLLVNLDGPDMGTVISYSLNNYTSQWINVAFTFDNTNKKLYFNNSLVASISDAGGPVYDSGTYNGGPIRFGACNSNCGSDFTQLYLDDVAIWNEALTAAEVTALYNSGLGLSAASNSGDYASASNLQGYWNFNAGTGTTLTDQTSNDNDGTIYGATWSTDVPFTGATTTSPLTWSVRAKASLSTYNDNDNYLGVASSATNVFDASYDALEPPAAPGSSISLYFPHAEWDYLLGDNFSTDARPVVALTDTMQVWDFVVKSTDAGEATLTFVYASVPSVPVILENTATGARQTLSNNATYTFTAVADSAHPFRVSIGDTTAPTLTLGASCSGPAILISDSTHTLGWTSTDGFEVDSVLVSFSSDSGTTYSLQASLGTASSYNWTVPDAMVMTGGKLKLKAQDYAGNSKEEVSSYVFAIAGDSLSSAVTAGWTLWGAPINPTNDAMTTNLADDFSGYWDTFDYVDNGYTYNGILKEAEGYWLGADQNATIDVKGTPVDSNFTVSLSQGWELISNPLVLDVSVDSLTFTKDNTTKTHAEAVTAGWVNSIYSYSSSGYVSATTFSPWSGYWMAVLETGVEITYPIHRNGGSRSSRSIENEWMISFDAQVDGGNDGITRIGYAETATDGFDTEHDAVKPPNPPGPEYVSLFIAHPEWNYPLGDKFAKDIRAAVPANGYQEWQLTMESSESDAQLSWTLVNIPDDYEVGYSTDGGQYFDDMRDVSTITISANTEITFRVGSQVLGIGDEPIPTVFALHQNYPNPFNPVTTLRYDLPENGIVTIIIYDMLGRQVKTLINQTQDAGFKSVVWNATNDYGKPVSAGIYLYQIQAGENISTKKMVLLK